MKKTMYMDFSRLRLIVAVFATAMVVASSIGQTVFATIVKDHGASGLTPKEDPQIPGWDPGVAPDDAPGQLKEGPHCIGCAADLAPGYLKK